MPASLDTVSVILVDTKTPANIGSVARCMMNMGLSRLVLVNPPRDRQADARRLAAGADDILERARIVSTLRDAVTDQGLVVGATRHRSRRRKNIHTPRELAEQVASLAARNNVSIVFGNEVNGLENADLALCHALVSIPSSSAFPSLNLSHAVMIVLYELFLAAGTADGPADGPLAPAQDLELFYLHLQRILEDADFIDRAAPERMMHSLRRIFGRALLDPREVRILRGILTAVERKPRSGSK
jgi:TrmH family RNA methyltransferase